MGRFLRGKDGKALTNKKIDQQGEIGTDLSINTLQSDDSTVLTVRDGLNVDGDLEVTGSTSGIFKVSTVRCQKLTSSTFPYQNWETPVVLNGEVSVVLQSGSESGYPALSSSSYYFIFTLTGFTHVPLAVNVIGGATGTSYLLGDMNYLDNADSGSRLLSDGSTNVLTNFTPSIHKWAFYIGDNSPHDYYFQFVGF